MAKVLKKDFTIKGHFTGNRIAGRENEFKYHVYYNGMQIDKDGFTSKAKADQFAGQVAKWINDRRSAK